MRLLAVLLLVALAGCAVDAEAPATTAALGSTEAELACLRGEVKQLRESLDALAVLMQAQMEIQAGGGS